MNRTNVAVAAVCCLVLGTAGAMTRDEYQSQRVRIQYRFSTDKDRCTSVAPEERKACEMQARAEYDNARAELWARFKPGPASTEKVERVRADGKYDVARARCEELQRSARRVCLDEAKAERKTALADAKAERVAHENGPGSRDPLLSR